MKKFTLSFPDCELFFNCTEPDTVGMHVTCQAVAGAFEKTDAAEKPAAVLGPRSMLMEGMTIRWAKSRLALIEGG